MSRSLKRARKAMKSVAIPSRSPSPRAARSRTSLLDAPNVAAPHRARHDRKLAQGAELKAPAAAHRTGAP
jgi:hypothetical protein